MPFPVAPPDQKYGANPKLAPILPDPPSHAGLPVPGYQTQSQANVDLVAQNKYLEEVCLRRIDEMKAMGNDVDGRWIAIGTTLLEQAFMALNRAVFRPGRVALPDDAEGK